MRELSLNQIKGVINFFPCVGCLENWSIRGYGTRIITPKCFPTTEQFTFNNADCKQVTDVKNAMPSNKAPGIDKVPT